MSGINVAYRDYVSFFIWGHAGWKPPSSELYPQYSEMPLQSCDLKERQDIFKFNLPERINQLDDGSCEVDNCIHVEEAIGMRYLANSRKVKDAMIWTGRAMGGMSLLLGASYVFRPSASYAQITLLVVSVVMALRSVVSQYYADGHMTQAKRHIRISATVLGGLRGLFFPKEGQFSMPEIPQGQIFHHREGEALIASSLKAKLVACNEEFQIPSAYVENCIAIIREWDLCFLEREGYVQPSPLPQWKKRFLDSTAPVGKSDYTRCVGKMNGVIRGIIDYLDLKTEQLPDYRIN